MLGLKNLRYFCFWKNRFEIDQRWQFNKKDITKIYFAVCILGRCLLTVKKYFQMDKLRLSFVTPQNTQIFLLLLGDIKGHTKNNLKRYFSRTSRMLFFFRAIVILVSVIFGNVGFWEIKDHSLTTTPFQKYILLWKV